MQDNQLKTLDSAYYSIEEGQAWTPVFVQENEDYIVLQAGCGSPCWIGIFLPLHNNDQPKVINEYLAFNLKSALVASINNDSIEKIGETLKVSPVKIQKWKEEALEKISFITLKSVSQFENQETLTYEIG